MTQKVGAPMTSLTKAFRNAILGVAVLAGVVGCSKAPEENQQPAAAQPAAIQPVAAATALQAAPERGNPATTPKDPSLKGFWLSYSEVDKRADLEYDRKLSAEDGKAISSVTISLPKSIPNASPDDYASMQVRNKAVLDFMSACLGPENTKTITQLSEGVIMVYTTPLKLRNTFEFTHVAAGQKNYVTDDLVGCQNTAKADTAVAKLKADNGFRP